jgi:hypothetical protein
MDRFTQLTKSTRGSNIDSASDGNGTRIAFLSISDLTGDRFEILLYDTPTGHITQITSNLVDGGDYIPAINDDGTRIAYVDNHALVLAVLTTGPTPDLIFQDGFESGNLSKWTASITDGGDLGVSTAAKLVGNFGMRANIDDNNAIYVTDDTPAAEARYRSRFYFDPNSITMANGNAHHIFYGYAGATTAVLRVEFRFSNGNYQLRAALLNNATTWTNSAWFTVSDAVHRVELDWQAATAVGANNGSLKLWLDGVQKANLTAVDNATRRIDRVRLGAMVGMDTGTRGTYYFDAFESRRQSFIGLTSNDLAASSEVSAELDTTMELDPSSVLSFDVDALAVEVATASDAAGTPLTLVVTPTTQVVPPAGSQVLGPLFTVDAYAPDGGSTTALAQPATLVIDYSGTVSESSQLASALAMQAWHQETGTWETLPALVDAENHTLTVVIQQWAIFAITQQAGTATQRIHLPFIQR